MAWNNGMGYGMPGNYNYMDYMNRMNQMQNSMNPYGQQMNTLPTQQSQVNGLVKVNGMDGAKAYQMPPNSAMPLFHESEDVFYLKVTDGAGFPTIKAFSFSPLEENLQPQVDTSGFATKSDIEDLQKQIEAIKNQSAQKKTQTTKSE
jgi:hypothetical protein